MKKGLFLLPLLALIFWSQLGWAATDSIGNTFGLGPRAGYYRSRDAKSGAWYGGLQARFRVGEFFGLEGAVDYRLVEKFKVDAGPVSGEVKQHSYPVTQRALHRRVEATDLLIRQLVGLLDGRQTRGVEDLVGVGVANAAEEARVGE